MMTPPPDQQQCDIADRHIDQSQAPPEPPKPENDNGIVPPARSPDEEDDDFNPDNIDIFVLKPVSALKLLCHSIDFLVRLTGDVPPTPPPARTSTRPRSTSRSNTVGERIMSVCASKQDVTNLNLCIPNQEETYTHDSIDGIPFKRTPIGSPDSNPWEAQSPPQEDVGYNSQPHYIQHASLARKFYSKRPPPISTEEYLMRMHKYCPMSTAVYLATSLYLSRLAVQEKVLPVTPRNVHRLLLAGLRVAMKALEDLSWPHGRFSKVGGVSESELGRLEITFCFLTGFVLKVNPEQLQGEARALAKLYRDKDAALLDSPISGDDRVKRMELRLPENKLKQAPSSGTRTPEKRKASSALPDRPALCVGAGLATGIEVMGQS